MTALDGNAIGGLLHDIFGTDLTGAEATCATCGAVGPVAGTVVYLRGPGTVVRSGPAPPCSWSYPGSVA